MIYQLLLDGFDENTDETDHLVKWIKAPTGFAVELFIQNQGLVGALEETPFDDNDVGFGDGLDIEINESGDVIRTDNEIDVKTWKEQHAWPDHIRRHRVNIMGDWLFDLDCFRCWLERVATDIAASSIPEPKSAMIVTNAINQDTTVTVRN